MTSLGTILIVDDERKNRRLLEALLSAEGYVTRTAVDGPSAVLSAQTEPPDLILLDIRMPGMDGYQVAAVLKADPALASIPVIMVSAQTDRAARIAGLESGAEEFLTKPIDRTELYLRVRNLLRLKNLSDALQLEGSTLQEEVRSRTADLQRLAHFDALTGLANRTLFLERLADAVLLAEARDSSLAVLFIDIDLFRDVNDTLGHSIGDVLLRQLSQRLLQCAGVGDTLGRLGGDEFALVAVLENGRRDASVVARRIQDILRTPFDLDGNVVTVSASIGVTIAPEDATDPRLLIQFADTAMHRAKESGRNTHRFFVPQMNLDIHARLELEGALRSAVDNDEFVLHYQPKVDLRTGRIVGVEALLRWLRPGYGLVSPTDFIPVLESSGMMVGVGAWVLEEAARQISRWIGTGIGPLPIAVNVSARQFADGRLGAQVMAALRRHGVPSRLLELELTESMLMENTEQTVATLAELRRQGVRISLDDFGTGYSSLAYLRSFPIDTLKIDKQFVADVATNADDAALAFTIIRMAHGFNLGVIAEGVETAAQVKYLRAHGCDQMQGFYFSKPLPALELEALLASGVDLADELTELPCPAAR